MGTPIDITLSAKTWVKVEKTHRQLSHLNENGWGNRECNIFYETKKQKRHIISNTVENVLGEWPDVYMKLNEQNKGEKVEE